MIKIMIFSRLDSSFCALRAVRMNLDAFHWNKYVFRLEGNSERSLYWYQIEFHCAYVSTLPEEH